MLKKLSVLLAFIGTFSITGVYRATQNYFAG